MLTTKPNAITGCAANYSLTFAVLEAFWGVLASNDEEKLLNKEIS